MNKVKDLFKQYDTYGFPFSLVFDKVQELGAVPDWEGLIIDARRAGWSRKKILTTIEEGIVDSYGKELTPKFRELVDHILNGNT